MFLAAVIRLRLVETAPLPPYLGRAAHACFFELLGAVDQGFADELHNADRPKGFTVSDLIGLPAQAQVPAGQPCALRLTSTDTHLSQLLRDRILPGLPDRLQLGGQAFAVEGVATDAAAHPLAGAADPAELAASFLFRGPPPGNRITLTFASPTTFRSGGHNVPLPLPALVFGGYLDRWNAQVESQLSPDLRRFAEECVGVSRYRLETALVPVEPGAAQVGFTGTCQFTVLNHDNYWIRLLHLLAAFSFWCGTGYKTTMGLGQTRPPPPPRIDTQGGPQ
ncbi:MAG TPA: CRISPR system precrRNA processing endoribonuclease RAMP protein Cas6 [Chloroflexia bacterium]|nr:CRISPR system precrRNA processing endoribonuclease RAMP protein Cas6 [Chloroflexia bacterium]